MGKKKNKVQVFVLKPWCWYCEREFEDEKVLLQHQKSKHFKCQLCPRKLNTAGGLMVHSQQVHKCEPEPLTNTLPGRDGYDIEIFGMEGVPSNALQEWKARKEAEAGTAALAAAAAKNRPRVAYTVIPEADLQAALAQHKALMAKREVEVKAVQPAPAAVPQGVAPPSMPMPSYLPPFPPPQMSQYPPGLPPNMSMPPFPPAPGPGFAPNGGPPGIGMPMGNSPVPPLAGAPTGPRSAELAGPPTGTPTGPAGGPSDGAALSLENQQQQEEASQADVEPVEVLPPKDGVLWPDADHTPAQKRAQQPRYRYTSPTTDGANGAETGAGFGGVGRKRKAAADFI